MMGFILICGLHRNFVDPLAWVILILGHVFVIIVSMIAYRRLSRRGRHARANLIQRLKEVDVRSSELPILLEECFTSFDFDHSGSLDMDEARELLKCLLHGKVGASAFTEAMLTMRSFANAECLLTLPALNDAITHVLSHLGMVDDSDASVAMMEDTHSRSFRMAPRLKSIKGGIMARVTRVMPVKGPVRTESPRDKTMTPVTEM